MPKTTLHDSLNPNCQAHTSLTPDEHAPAKNQESSTQSLPLDPLTSAFVPDVVAVPPPVSRDALIPGTENHETNPVTDSSNPPPDNSSIVQAQLNAISKVLEIQNQNRFLLPKPGVF